MDYRRRTSADLEKIRRSKPLIHNITGSALAALDASCVEADVRISEA